jgi:phosphoserine aminotransferase
MDSSDIRVKQVRVFNFSAGPATLPLEVLEQARDEMIDWQHSGMSVMEVSHRSKAFVAVAQQAEADLRELLAMPDELQGAVPAGRRHRPVRRDPDEPRDAGFRGRLRQHGATGRRRPAARRRSYCKVNVIADGRPATTPTCRPGAAGS